MSPSVGWTRTEADFVAHIAQTIVTDPDAKWTIVLDQRNTHQSQGLARLVAQLSHLPHEVGVKDKSGILKSMASRAAFLSDPTHRNRFVYTPKHSSWLNQIETWFSTLVRRLLKRVVFTSVEALRQRLLDFIAFFNRTAKPYKWTYKGRPLKA